MMCETGFDLHQALEGYDDPKSFDFEGDSGSPVKFGVMVQKPHCDPYAGVKLEVVLQPHSMRQVAHLVIAVQRMKNTMKLQGTEFSDHELLNIMMENIIEECVVMTVQNPDKSGAVVYTSTNQVVKCNVADQYQKSWIRNEEALKLQAMTLQGGNFHRKVQLNLSTYVCPSYTVGQGQPVTLGITETDLFLSCSKENDVPILQLERVSDRSKMKTINEQDDLSRFLFLKKGTGFSMTTFESAKYKGWFISTAIEEQEPVEMCTMQEANRITSFMVK
ncbi:interleukin-1 beta [Arapaima gigas]